MIGRSGSVSARAGSKDANAAGLSLVVWGASSAASPQRVQIPWATAAPHQSHACSASVSPGQTFPLVPTIVGREWCWLLRRGLRTQGPRTGLNASQLNKLLGDMRGENRLAFLLFLLASARAIHWRRLCGVLQLRKHLYASVEILDEDKACECLIQRCEAAIGRPRPKSGFFE